MEENKDPHLWKLAKQRVLFRRHVYLFFAINLFLWIIWIFSYIWQPQPRHWPFPWPLFPTIGWGIAVVFQFWHIYSPSSHNELEEEYEKLKREEKERNSKT